jgi:hypothetical protein
MIIQLVARNTTQINNTDSSSTTGATHTPRAILTRPNLIGVLVIAVLLVLGITLWLCFGKWSKPIRHFLKRKSCSPPSLMYSTGATPFGICDGPRAVAVPRSVPRAGPEGANAEKAEIMDSSSSSTQCSLLDQDTSKTNDSDGDKVELALPAKVLQTKSGSRLAGLVR